MQLKTLPIFLAFFLMGLADAMGPNSDNIKEAYKAEKLNDFSSTLPTFAVFIAFAVFSVPGGLLAARIGKKNLLLLGLGLNFAALLVPILWFVLHPKENLDYNILLVCIFTLGAGTTFLQVAGNPIMRDVSAEGNYSRNLAFAQGIKGIGSTASTYLLAAIGAIPMFKAMGWQAGFPFFCGLMAIAFVGVLPLKINETKADVPPSIGSSLSLLGEPVFLLAVIGIFLYVGAEASMGRFLKPALMRVGFEAEAANTRGPTLFFLMLTVGRIGGGAILSIMSPRTCFRLSAALGVLGAIAIMFAPAAPEGSAAAQGMSGGQILALVGVVAAGLGFANIWPMLFSLTVEEKPGRASELSGLMCMAISGGAIVPLVMGKIRDSVSADLTPYSFAVPAACFAYLLLLSLRGATKPAKGAAA
jgi:fucose permease